MNMEQSRAHTIKKRFKNQKIVIGAEIGVYKGNLSKILLKEIPSLYLYMIDRWRAYTDIEVLLNDGSMMSLRSQKVFDAAYLQTQIIHQKFPDRSKIIKCSSLKAAKKFKKGFLDFCFLDADHSYPALYREIKVWVPKIKTGGWICGHDYHRESVKKAVNELLTNVETDYNTTWFVRVK